jgi:hypothetical protein
MIDRVAIFRNNPQTGKKEAIAFDAVFEERHEAILEVTDNPVETGVVVSDHAFMKPLAVTISGGVSDTPMHRTGNDRYAPVSDAAAETIRQMLPNAFIFDSRSKKAFQVIQELQATAQPFDLQTGLRLYRNMVCLSIRASQDKDTSSVLIFEAVFREVLIVNTETVKYKLEPGTPQHRQASPKKKKGEQQGKEVTDRKKAESLLIQLGQVLGFTGKDLAVYVDSKLKSMGF